MSILFNFLRKLANNNNREWFTDNKNEFERAKKEAEVIFDTIYNQMSLYEELEPLKNYRIYRDIRFSNDKTPYKNHLSAQTGRKKPYNRGGYYFHLEPKNSFIAAGFWEPERNDLLKIRKNIEFTNELKEIIDSEKIENEFGKLEGEELKTAPRGFSMDHERIELLRKKQYIFIKNFTEKEVLSNEFPGMVVKSLKVLSPFFIHMTEVLTTNENGEVIV